MKNADDTKGAVLPAVLLLAEGLDYPRLDLVTVAPGNPFLRCLAQVEGAEGAWEAAVSWMERAGTAGERLTELRREYYRLFLRAERNLYCHLHEWFPQTAPQAFLGDWHQFLCSTNLAPSDRWRNGPDHVAIVFEVLAHLLQADHPQLRHFTRAYLAPWLPRFAERLRPQAESGFYIAAAGVAKGLADEIPHLL